MPRVEIPLIGPSYTNRERPLSAQKAINMWPEINPEARNQVALHNVAGTRTFATLLGSVSRLDTVYDVINSSGLGFTVTRTVLDSDGNAFVVLNTSLNTGGNSFDSQYTTTNIPGADRGMHDFNNLMYAVNGTTLYKIDETGVNTALGTIPGKGCCQMADDGYQLIIVTGETPYRYTVASGLEAITDPDLVNPTCVAYINSQFVFDNNNGT